MSSLFQSLWRERHHESKAARRLIRLKLRHLIALMRGE